MSEKKTCPDCGHEIFVHYGLYCPVCYDPTPEMTPIYDLFRCMYHVQEKGHIDFKNKVWVEICDHEEVQNDIHMKIYKHCGTLVEEMFNVLGVEEDSAIFWISW